MSDINSVTLIGRLVEKPIVKYSSQGVAVANLRIANNTFTRNSPDGSNTKVNYFTIVVFGKVAENCERLLNKGQQIAVQGRLDQNTWEINGQKRSIVRIIANSVQFIGGKPTQTAATPSDEIIEPNFPSQVDIPTDERPTIPEETSEDINSTEIDSSFESPIDDSEDTPF